MGKGKEELVKMIPKLNASPRARNQMEAWPRIIQFKLEGEESPFHIVIDRGVVKLEEGAHANPNIIVTGNSKEFAGVLLGEKDITHPLLFGQLHLERGKNMEMITFSRILAAVTRKWGG